MRDEDFRRQSTHDQSNAPLCGHWNALRTFFFLKSRMKTRPTYSGADNPSAAREDHRCRWTEPALRQCKARSVWVTVLLFGLCCPSLRGETPALLARAIAQWTTGQEDLAFTQQTRYFLDDGKVKEERIERYDPSLPDNKRWRLIEVDGRPASNEQREKWERRKNGKPRKKVVKSPAEILDLDHAVLAKETVKTARFEIGLRPETARLLAVENITVVITVDKESSSIAHIAATLRQPIRVLLGLARITDLDLDVHIEPADEDSDSAGKSGEVEAGSTARVTMSKLGSPMEYNWNDFRRVASYREP